VALNLAPLGIRIAIIEKDVFPRDKICGDALSGKVMRVLQRIPGDIYADFLREVEKVPSRGIRFVAPNRKGVDIPFSLSYEPGQPAPGFICTRSNFDTFLFDRLRAFSNVTVFQGEKAVRVERVDDGIEVFTEAHRIGGRLLAGADGAQSMARKLMNVPLPAKKHFCVGIRAYFDGVTDLHPENFIELIFLKTLLPGYFWIFPSANGRVNAGLGVMQDTLRGRKENLSALFLRLAKEDPLLSPRFKNAAQISKPEAHILPLGTYGLRRSGNRALLLGDAAFLVDPFSGEGIGNAMASGEIAADVISQCFTTGLFSDSLLQQYDKRIHHRFSTEFKTSAMMQKLAHSSSLINFVINKARKSQKIRNRLTAMFTNEDLKKSLVRPGFYFKELFR